MPTSLEIAQSARLRPIADIAAELGILPDELESYGPYKAKVSLDAAGAAWPIDPTAARSWSRPSPRRPLGEGKTTTTDRARPGAQPHRRAGGRGHLRQPSLGPVFGIKGGGAGGGYSQVVPMEDINLHFTGDLHAVAAAHNLGAAFLDNHLLRGNDLDIDPADHPLAAGAWTSTTACCGGCSSGIGETKDVRESEFHITAASEVMAILALATDLADLRARIGRVIVGRDLQAASPVTLEDLRVAGAMTVLMRDAIKPNLVQTLEGGPAFVHAGPFANIAHGNSSVVADRVALKLVDAVVHRGRLRLGHGLPEVRGHQVPVQRPAAERRGHRGHHPGAQDARRRGHRGGRQAARCGAAREDPDAVRARRGEPGRSTSASCRQLRRAGGRGHQRLPRRSRLGDGGRARGGARAAGARDAVVARHFADGGAGAEELARAVWAVAQEGAPDFRFLTPPDATLAGAHRRPSPPASTARTACELSGDARRRRSRRSSAWATAACPVCMAKTQSSLSHDPALKGRPRGFMLPIRDARLFAGAGFVTAYCGDMRTMPGLPAHPNGEGVDLDADGRIVGLF